MVTLVLISRPLEIETEFLYFIIGLLRSINVHRASDLTPKCRQLYKKAMLLQKKLQNTDLSRKLFKDRLAMAQKASDNLLSDKLSKKMTVSASLFTRIQLRETHKKTNGRRFTLDEKVLSLSLYKRSPQCYRLLSKIFTLPCRRTLTSLLAKVPINTGISTVTMKVLKNNVAKLPPAQKYCSLLFDEMSISAELHYNETLDMIEGFEDYGYERTQQFADHALVFYDSGHNQKV